MSRSREPAALRERRAAVTDFGPVLEAALRFLEPRARSVAEVRRRLSSAGYRADLVEAVVGRLVDLGMLDDAAFARAWVESRDRGRPRGEHALRRELRGKGVADEVIGAILAERDAVALERAPDEPSADEVAARRLLDRRGAALARIGDPRLRRQRAYALLARGGFDPETAARIAAAFARALDAP